MILIENKEIDGKNVQLFKMTDTNKLLAKYKNSSLLLSC